MKKLLLLTLLTALSAHGADNVVTEPAKLREITDKYRSDPSRPNDFTPQGDGTVIDKRTGLQWMRCSMGQTWTGETCEGEPKKYQWQEAMGLKETFAGHSDWRLPTRFELETLVYCSSGQDNGRDDKDKLFYLNVCRGNYQTPTIVQKVFPNMGGSDKYIWYWSSSSYADDDFIAWGVDFNGGDGNDPLKDDDGYVQFVRSGQ